MRKILENRPYIQYLLILSAFLVFNACEYRDVADAEYGEQQVYMSGAYNGVVYKLDQINEDENSPFRYKIDSENNKLVIPLAIYRSYVNSNSNVTAQLEVNNDTIPGLIDSEALAGDVVPEVLPEGKYELNTNVTIDKGSELGKFELLVDIPFLLENLDKRFVLGIRIKESNAKINENLSLIVVDILSAFVEAHPNFTFIMNDKHPLDVEFTNTSTFCLSYEWDFGDSSPVVSGENPGKHTFPGVGIYNVKLTSKGTRGNTITTTKVVHIWEDITTAHIKNAGNPFAKVGLVSGRVDVLTDWLYTQNVLSTYNATNNIYIGGYQGDNGGVVDFYANRSVGGALVNAKIYQTITSLPAGSYYSGFTPFSFTGENDCYFVVTKANTLPDIENLDTDPNVIGYYNWNKTIEEQKYGVEFSLLQAQDVTIGFVVSNAETARVKIKSVFISK